MKINAGLALFLMVIGALAVVSAGLKALGQRVIAKQLFYHTVSQAGYVALGIGTLTSVGMRGGILSALNGIVCLGYMFLVARRVGHIGSADAAPVIFICWLIASLSVSAVWPLPGFFSVWMICRGIAQHLATPAGRFTVFLCLSAAVFGTVITLAGFMRLLQAVFFNKK